MGNLAVSKYHYPDAIYYSAYDWANDEWTELVEVTDKIEDPTKTFVFGSEGFFEPDVVPVPKYRLISYYNNPVTIDKFYISGITEKTGLNFSFFGGNDVYPNIPTSPMVVLNQSLGTEDTMRENKLFNFDPALLVPILALVLEIDGGPTEQIPQDAFPELYVNGQFDGGTGFFDINITSAAVGNVDFSNDTMDLTRNNATGGTASVSQLLDLKTEKTLDYIFSFDFVGGNWNGGTSGTGGNVIGNVDVKYDSDLDTLVNLPEDIRYVSSATSPNGVLTEPLIGTTFTYALNDLPPLDPDKNDAYQVSFTVSAAPGASGNSIEIDNVSFRVDPAQVMTTTTAFDVRGIFFGEQVYTPKYNFIYGAKLGTEDDYVETTTPSSHYQHKKSGGRIDRLQLEHVTREAVKDLEKLRRTLTDGRCFYQRDVDSLDTYDFFLANFRYSAKTLTAFDHNDVPITFRESHEHT